MFLVECLIGTGEEGDDGGLGGEGKGGGSSIIGGGTEMMSEEEEGDGEETDEKYSQLDVMESELVGYGKICS
jgi:hypothetical protein